MVWRCLSLPPTRQDLTKGLFYYGDFKERGSLSTNWDSCSSELCRSLVHWTECNQMRFIFQNTTPWNPATQFFHRCCSAFMPLVKKVINNWFDVINRRYDVINLFCLGTFQPILVYIYIYIYIYIYYADRKMMSGLRINFYSWNPSVLFSQNIIPKNLYISLIDLQGYLCRYNYNLKKSEEIFKCIFYFSFGTEVARILTKW